MKDKIKILLLMILEFIVSVPPIRFMIWLIKKPSMLFLFFLIGLILYSYTKIHIDAYIAEYHRVNNPELKVSELDEFFANGSLEFKEIDDGLYTLTGPVGPGDCERIVPQMPDRFSVILESPGGVLSEGSCIAAHLSIREVTTVVRNDPVYNENGEAIYTPGLKSISVPGAPGSSVCASSCSIMFLGGDKRYLIGDVLFGIHGPGVPDEQIVNMHQKQVETSSLRAASALLELLEKLGVEDSALRRLFIKIPNNTMYWLNPSDFDAQDSLIKLATNYRNFHGFDWVDTTAQ